MNTKRGLFCSLLLGAAFLLSHGVSIDTSRAADAFPLVVAYSGNVLGYLQPCG